MAKVPATIEQVPSYLAKYREDTEFNKRFKDLSSIPIGMISLDGKHFTFRRSGQDDWLLSDKDDNPMQFLDICILDSNPNKSRGYWKKSLDPNAFERPDCASINGDVPDPGVPAQQSPTCPSCRWSKWNTAIKADGTPGAGQRCREMRRVVILPGFDLSNEEWGGPMLLRVPPTSLMNLTAYANERDRAGQNLNMIITRMRYDPQVRHQQLQFAFNRWLDEEEEAMMARWFNDPIKDRIMYANVNEKGEDIVPSAEADDDDIEEEVSAVEAKAVQQQAAADKIAAAKSVAATAGKGNGQSGPVRRVAATEPEAGPVKRKVVAEEPAPPKRAAVVTPVAAKKSAVVAAKTSVQIAAEKKARLDALLAEAAALDEELNPEGADEEGQPLEASGETEAMDVLADEEGDDVSTAELLGALDSQDLHGVPD